MRPAFSILAHLVFVLPFVGCGGEDFSAPPPELAELRAKAQAKTKQDKPAETFTVSPQSTEPDATVDNAAEPAADAPPTASDGGAVLATGDDDSAKQPPTRVGMLAAAVEPDDTNSGLFGISGKSSKLTDTASKKDDKAASGIAGNNASSSKAASATTTAKDMKAKKPDEAVATAIGKTESLPEESKGKKETKAKAGTSLLDKLKASEDEPKKNAKGRSGSTGVRQVMTQTGRTAIAVGTWFRLRNQLAKRFYVAATSDGKKFAASSGESSLAVVNTQLSEPEEVPVGPAMAARIRQLRLQKLEVTTQDVSDLPGTISCVEIIQQGDVVLAGTEDGRLLARSCADLQDWDLYAQDLFAWQDEHRAATRISDTAVLVVKAINGERLLTVDANHVCRIWNIVDVV